MDKIKCAFSSAFSGLFLVYTFVQFVQIVYRKDCIMCMKMRRRMQSRGLKLVVLASILSDFLALFDINICRIKYKQNVEHRQIVQFYTIMW